MMAMTKKDFATRLLFWLLPWPLSKALPRSLRIYYFGPTAGPPPGFYDYWGVPGFFWPDPDTPPDPDLFPDLPDDIFNPGDPLNPPPPDEFPDLPDGPTNPSDPYTPGGPDGYGPPRLNRLQGIGWFDYTNLRYWTIPDEGTWQPIGHKWEMTGLDTNLYRSCAWTAGWRPTHFRIEHNSDTFNFELVDMLGNDIVNGVNYTSMESIPITWGLADLKGFYLNLIFPCEITRIEFYGSYIAEV